MRKRKSKKLDLRPTIRIYCEGKTEENYFNMLKQKYHQSNVFRKFTLLYQSKINGSFKNGFVARCARRP